MSHALFLRKAKKNDMKQNSNLFIRLKIKTNWRLRLCLNLKFWIIVIFFFIDFNSKGQVPNIPEIGTPKPATFKPNVIIGTQTNNTDPIYVNPNYMNAFSTDYAKINNQAVMDEVEKNEVRIRSEQLINEAAHEFNRVNYEPVHYRKALDGLKNILEGKEELSIKKAVYLVENAYYDDKLNYEEFNKQIQQLVEFVKLQVLKEGYSFDNPVAVNLMIQKVLSQPIEVKSYNLEKDIVHEPFTYDLEDNWGKKDYSKMFVSKLLRTNSGQCHSLPLLYLIVAEELGIEAFLTLAPNHSYIKFKDAKGKLYNYETTNGHLVSDIFVMSSGYIKAEALNSGIYMDTLSKKQAIARCLVDLGSGYENRFKKGIIDGSFLLECAAVSFEHNPHNNIGALMTVNNVYLNLVKSLAIKYRIPDPDDLIRIDKDAKKFWELYLQADNELKSIGCEQIPDEVYEVWRKSAEEEKFKRDNEKYQKQLMKSIR
jgi:hypothetical protein